MKTKSCTSRESNLGPHDKNRRTTTEPVELTTPVSWWYGPAEETRNVLTTKGANGIAIGTWEEGQRLVPIGIEPAT